MGQLAKLRSRALREITIVQVAESHVLSVLNLGHTARVQNFEASKRNKIQTRGVA